MTTPKLWFLACAAALFLGACPTPTPTRDCPVGNPAVACPTDDNFFCQEGAGRRVCAATDSTTFCCNNACRYTLAALPGCVCIADATETCQKDNKPGTRTCVVTAPDTTSWGECVVPATPIDAPIDSPAAPPPAITYFRDDDGDGFCGTSQSSTTVLGSPWKTSCSMEPQGCDGNARSFPGNPEVCGNGVDDDCAGGDAACPPPPTTTYFSDPDGDSYCGLSQAFTSDPGAPWKATCRTEPAGCEHDATRSPGKREICGNGKDDDCRGGDKACECPASAPVKCECSGGFISDCMSMTMCSGHHPHCGNSGSGCACIRR